MADSNFYLELLRKQVRELTRVVKDKELYSLNAYNCILAGIVIRMNSILEQCLIDFHSDNFTDVAEIIYNSRQLLVHYCDYRTFESLEETSKEIIEKFHEAYESEREYFAHILEFENTFEHNVVIPRSKNVVFDEFTNCYVFKTDEVEISVSKDKVTRIQDLKKRRDVAYIVNCDGEMNYLKKGEDYESFYQELSGHEQLQDFFISHFDITGVNFTRHKQAIRDMLDSFYKEGNFSSVYVEEKLEDDKRKPLWIEVSKVLDKYFNEGIVYSQLLEDRIYSNVGIPQYDYYDFKRIKSTCKNDLETHISKRDFFFITQTISMFDNLSLELIKNKDISDYQLQRLKTAMLINWADHTLKNFTDDFINSNEEFKSMHYRLLAYRNFFAHNVLQTKTGITEKLLEEFHDLAKGYVSVISSLNVKKITILEQEEMINFIAIERTPRHFINYKYEQYVKLDPTTYIGNKLFYSTRGSDYHKIIGLVGVDKGFPLRGGFYDKKGEEFVAKTFKTRGGKSHNWLVSKFDYSKGKNVSFDINCNTMLYVYAAFKGKIPELAKQLTPDQSKRIVVFTPSEENNYQGHATDLDEVISSYYQQRFLPFELVRPTKAVLSFDCEGKPFFSILDENDKEVAVVVNKTTFKKMNTTLDKRGYFTINETINDFNKGRI